METTLASVWVKLARSTKRPIRPNPLIPTFTTMIWCFDECSEATTNNGADADHRKKWLSAELRWWLIYAFLCLLYAPWLFPRRDFQSFTPLCVCFEVSVKFSFFLSGIMVPWIFWGIDRPISGQHHQNCFDHRQNYGNQVYSPATKVLP